MNVTLRKIGNSVGIIIPKDVLDRLGLKVGDSLQLESKEADILLRHQNADLTRQIESARKGMAKYRNALRELAK